MATSSNRDVKMTLSVETLGQENIKTLQNAVASLAKEGGDAAPEFQQLADEIGRIGEQAQAIAAFKDLAVQTDALAAKQQEAATKASELAAKLALSGDAAQTASQKQKEASAALLNAKTIFDGTVTGIKNLNAEYKAGKVTAENYKTKLVDLTAAQGEQRNKFAALSAEVKLATTELSKADAEQTKLTGQYTRADAALTKATQALSTHNKAVAESAQAAEKLGTSTENVATSEAALLQALNASRTAALARTESMREMEDSDKLVAIQAQGMAELLERGRVALIAEEAAIREAARASAEYTEVRNAENAARAAAEDKWQKESFAIVEATEAKQRNIAATKNLIEAQNFLIAQDADAKWLADAAAMTKANEASFNLRRETERLTEAERQLASEIKQTGDAAQKVSTDIANAFRTVGVRSAQELEAEIVQVRQAMDALKTNAGLTGSTLSTAFATGEAKIKDLERELRSVNGTLTLGDKTAKLFANSLGQISAGNVIADGVGYLVNKVKELAQGFLNVNLESQRLTKALTQVYGDAGKAGAQFDFLRDVTNKAGISIRDASDAFLRFSASTAGSNVSLEESNAVFKQVAQAAGFLGLSGEKVTGIFEALGQMASKDVISLEELRGQLGDRLPNALGIAAKGMRMTTQDLIKMIESGGLAVNVFFPAFRRGLNETFGDGEKKIEGFIQGWNRLLNAIVKTAQQASDSAAFTNMGKAFDFVAENIKAVTTGLELLAVRFGIIKAVEITASFLGLGNAANKAAAEIAKKAAATELDTAATTLNTAATNLNSAAKTQNAAQWSALGTGVLATSTKVQAGTAAVESATLATRTATVAKAGLTAGIGLLGSAATKLTGLLGGPIGALIMFGVYAKEIGTWVGEGAAKMLGWGAVLEKNEKQIKALAAAEKKAAKERADQQAEQDLLNMKASAAAVAATKQSELSVASAKEEVKAKQEKLKATQDLVSLQGPEAKGLAALTAASIELTTAAQAELVAKQNLVAKTTEEIAAIQLTKGANGELTKSQNDQIFALGETLKARNSDVASQKETIRQLEIETASRRVASETLKDNSGRVDDLTAAYENAKTKLSTMAASGVASLAQLQKAEVDVAVALKLKNDALDDSVLKSITAEKQTQANIASTKSEIDARIAHNSLLKTEAELRGDLTASAKLEIAGKQLVIDQLKLEIQSRTSANNAALTQLETSRKLIDGSTDIGKQQIKEIDIAAQLIKAKEALNIASGDVVKGLEKELAASKNTASGMVSLVDAYKQLGVQSPQELAKVASANADAWNTIKSDANAGVDTIKAAFEAYAKSAIAASGEVGSSQRQATEEMLTTEAAAKGLTAAFDDAGKMIVTSMSSGSKAIQDATGYMGQLETAAERATSALEKQNTQLERANAAKEKAIELENKRLNIDKEGYSLNTNGDRVSMAVNTERTLYDNAKGQGLSDAQALQIVNQFMQNGRQVGGDQNANNGGTWSSTVQDAIDKVVLQNARAEPSKKDNTVTETPSESDQSTIIKMMRDAGLAYSSGITMEEATAKVAMVNANKEASQKAKSAYGAATPVATQSSAPTTQKSEQDILRNYMEAAGLTYTPGISRGDAETAVQSKQRADEASKAGVKNATPAPTASAKTYTVNVNMGGTNTAINTSSDADAQALISLLQRAKLSA